MEPYRPNCYKIPELNGLRVLLVFIVSWYHFWQQSWLTPSIGSYSLDYLLRAGYMPVDGTILLSGFLLFLPYARAMLLGEAVPDTKQFYQRRIMRIVPSYYFVTLALLFAVALPWHLYYNSSDMVRDVVMHLTFTQTFNPATYITTPIGVASWTIAIEMQAYLIFPLLARWAMKNPLGTLMTMAAGTFAFRGWCVWRLDEYNMEVNQLANFLDIYALGMGAALLYVWLVQRYPAAEKRKAMAWQGIATLLCVLSTWGMLRIFRVQAGESGQAALQAGQMMRRPLLGLAVAGILLTLPFAARPLRFLMGNRVMGWLAAVSMNYYLLHQNLAVHLKRLGVPPSVSAEPNRAGEQPWQLQYTLLCFGLSLLGAALITLLIEKPCAKVLKKMFARTQSIICAFGLAAAAPRSPYRHLELCGVAQSLWCGCSSLLHWVTKCDVLFKLHLQQALHTTAGGWPHFREEVRTMRFTFTFHVGRKTITLGLVVKSKNRHPGR